MNLKEHTKPYTQEDIEDMQDNFYDLCSMHNILLYIKDYDYDCDKQKGLRCHIKALIHNLANDLESSNVDPYENIKDYIITYPELEEAK